MSPSSVPNIISLAAIAATAWLLLRKKEGDGEQSSVSPAPSSSGAYPNPAGRTLGYRNNNPLNIEYTGTVWKGEIRPSCQYRFAQFVSIPYGYRAGFRTIRTYINNYGVKTVRDIIHRWDVGNNNYVNFVCAKTGFSPDTVINPYDKQQMESLVSAMSWMENGFAPRQSEIDKGYYLYQTV